MNSLTKVTGEDMGIKPIVARAAPRKNCPFYGFQMVRGMGFLDSNGNQCSLTGEYRSCMMEVDGEESNWDMCPYFNTDESKEKLEEYAKTVRVFPDEFGENGVSLGEWIQYITSVRN